MTQRTVTGSCHCKAITYEASLPADLSTVTKCNCTMCQKPGMIHIRLDSSGKDFKLLTPASIDQVPKWFSAQKGFGFIAPDDGTEDLFVHQTSIQSDGFRTLSEGQPVEYVVDSGEDGRTKAIEVAAISKPRRHGGRGGRRGGGGFYSGRDGGGGGYGRGGRGGRGGACYNCGRTGHLARDCFSGGGGGGGRRGDGGGGGGCYNCGEEGHYARDCPNKDEQNLVIQ